MISQDESLSGMIAEEMKRSVTNMAMTLKDTLAPLATTGALAVMNL